MNGNLNSNNSNAWNGLKTLEITVPRRNNSNCPFLDNVLCPFTVGILYGLGAYVALVVLGVVGFVVDEMLKDDEPSTEGVCAME